MAIAFGVIIFGVGADVLAGWHSKGNEEHVSELNIDDQPLPDAKTGTPLPAGGGEPGKAYMIYLKAIQNKDLKTIRKIGSLDEDDVPEFAMEESLDLLAEMAPRNVKIVKGYVKGIRAALYAEGISENEKQYAVIEMVKEKSGQWRVRKENWSNVRPKKW